MALKRISNRFFINNLSFCTNSWLRRNYMRPGDHAVKQGYGKKKFNEAPRFASVQEDMISREIKNFNTETIPKWDQLKINTLKEGHNITDVNIDAKIITTCIAHKNLEAAKSFMNHLYEKNLVPNIATLGKFLRLFYVCNEEQGLSKKDEKTVLNIYKDLSLRCPILDSLTAENVIVALSLTNQWRECFNVLEMQKFVTTPAGVVYSAIAKAAFKNNDERKGWTLINEGIMNNRIIKTGTYSEFLKLALKDKKTTIAKIEYLFNYFATNDILPCKELTDEISDILHSFGYSGSYTTVFKETCKHCQGQLEKVSLTEQEFQTLKSVFFNNCIIGKNIFNKTSPDELERFKEFMSKAEPYDIVIDGLNVAYSAGVKKPSHIYANMLQLVVDYFAGMSMRVLVLGRVHMKHWPKDCINYCRKKADVFLTQNISEDDPYLIYAAMHSGLGTSFLSRDSMRGHAYLLMDTKIRRLFRRWQQIHQHSLIYADIENKKVHIKYPTKSNMTLQKYKNGWHIPYLVDSSITGVSTSLEVPKNWLCIQKVT